MLALAFAACTNHPKLPATYETAGSLPDIYPDYTDVVVPPNIAPLNFSVLGEKKAVLLKPSRSAQATRC